MLFFVLLGDIPLEEMDGYARQATELVELGSYCTVFSATEVLGNS